MPNTDMSSLVKPNETAIRVFRTGTTPNVGYGTLTVGGLNIKFNIFKSATGIRIAWPQCKLDNGTYKDLVTPASKEYRTAWAIAIRDAYLKLNKDDNPIKEPPAKDTGDADDNW